MHFITELRWREDRVEHIARHEVGPVEVEEAVFEDRRGRLKRIGPAKRDRKQTIYEFYGRAESGRYLFIVLIHLGGGIGFPVTARDMTKEERHIMAEPRRREGAGRQWSENEKRELAEKIESMSIEELAEFFDNTDTADLPMEDASDEIQIQREMEQISVRLPKEDVEALKRRAKKSGVGYTTLLRMIVHEHVHSPLTR